MSKLVLSVQVDDIESVVNWYPRMYDAVVLYRGEFTATLEFANKIVNYIEYGTLETDSLWDTTVEVIEDKDLDEIIYESDMSIEDFDIDSN
jgi:hypothetical protein